MNYYSTIDFYSVRDAVFSQLATSGPAWNEYEIATCITQAIQHISRLAPQIFVGWHDTAFPPFSPVHDTPTDFAISEKYTHKTHTNGNLTAWIAGIDAIYLSKNMPVGLGAVGGVPFTLENTDEYHQWLYYYDSTCARVYVPKANSGQGDNLQIAIKLSYTLSQHDNAQTTTLPRVAFQTLVSGTIYFARLSAFTRSALNSDDFYSWTNTNQRISALRTEYKAFNLSIQNLVNTIGSNRAQGGTYNHQPQNSTADDVPEIPLPNWDSVSYG